MPPRTHAPREYEGERKANLQGGPPVLDPLPAQNAHPGANLSFTATATDPDGDALKFNLENPPYGATIDPDSGFFSWTPLWNQNNRVYNVTVRVTDPDGQADSKSCQITIDNDGPALQNLPPLVAHPDQNVSFTAVADDADGDPLKFSLDNPPYNASIDPDSGFFSWTPDWNQLGPTNITVRVKDPEGLSVTKTCQISVENQGPTLDNLAAQVGHPGQPVNFTATANDPDGDPLKFSLVDAPFGAAIDPDSGYFYWTPDWNHIGPHTITIRVKDPEGLSDVKSCVITVANEGPELDDMAPLNAHPGQPVSFTATADDPDSDYLKFSLVDGPFGAAIDPDSGYFGWTPDWNHLGPNTIAVRVKDPEGLTDVKQCVITVGNNPPALNAIPVQNVTVGNPVSFTATANDPDNDPLFFSLDSPPFGAGIDSASGYFYWIPDTAGDYSILVRVKDPDGLTDVKSVTIHVTP